MPSSDPPPDIDSLWEYSDPAASEARFRAALQSAQGDARLELLTQLARTFGLRGRFGEAHAVLDEVEGQLAAAGARARVRYLLERGRAFNSGGEKDKARALFEQAWQQAQPARSEGERSESALAEAGVIGLAVDAAHMLAIAAAGTPDGLAWNQRGLELARASQDPKARALIPAMLNNSAWELHDAGRFGEALPVFEEAQAAWTERGRPAQIRIAKWSLARCLRSLGRYEEALAIQRALEAEFAAENSADGYVFEELAENLEALGKVEEARPYFAKAFAELSQDEWFVKNESGRLASLKRRAGLE